MRDPFLRVVLPWRGALAAYSAEGAPNWRDISQVRHIWRNIAQVLPHMRPILPFPSHLRHIVPGWREGGGIFCKCAAPWQNITQVRRAGTVAAEQQAGEGAGPETPGGRSNCHLSESRFVCDFACRRAPMGHPTRPAKWSQGGFPGFFGRAQAGGHGGKDARAGRFRACRGGARPEAGPRGFGVSGEELSPRRAAPGGIARTAAARTGASPAGRRGSPRRACARSPTRRRSGACRAP